MTKKINYTFDECKAIASSFSNRKDFHALKRTCFDYSKKMGWYDEITKHMPNKTPRKKTYKEVKDEALKYSSRMEFKEKSPSYYFYAVSHKWLNDVCSHMKAVGNNYKRCIYVYEFPNKKFYVGLTCNIDERSKTHMKDEKSQVYKECKKNGYTNIKPKILTEYVDKEKAAFLEGYYLKKYLDEGWETINVGKTGNLGGRKIKYEITKELCIEHAKKCETPTEFYSKYEAEHKRCKVNGWMDDIKKLFDNEKIKEIKNKRISESTKGKHKNVSHYVAVTHAGLNKKVIQYDKDGNFVNEYLSCSEAAKSLGHPKSNGDISKCCKGKLKYVLGYKWGFK